ncbi:hypothetical protein [Streptomyces rhizosphaerihabitans]|uniref:hypothetical protein n=1 Tax=Streptomyces rhizosphaerihabitans TaxID=1266770 RepID=UPI0021BE4936|nr:hypothetical protein [Streptomyces rhizosphaerihabitans]MCT9010917.1 hypothetical protein [Streptomyces rhizosphaerihabitans]
MKNHTLRIRVDETPEDRETDPSTRRQRFNRTEHLRQIPPDTHADHRLKGFRQDSEPSTPVSTRATPTRESLPTGPTRPC